MLGGAVDLSGGVQVLDEGIRPPEGELHSWRPLHGLYAVWEVL